MHGKFGLLSPGKASSHSTALPSYCFFLCAVFSCFRNPPYSDMTTGSLMCVRSCAHTHGNGAHRQRVHNVLTRENSHKFVLCSGRDTNLWSRNPFDLEADALPTEPPRPRRFALDMMNLSGLTERKTSSTYDLYICHRTN